MKSILQFFLEKYDDPSFKWNSDELFEVKTSLGAPHTFYSRAVN
jgi:hypothetical protein